MSQLLPTAQAMPSILPRLDHELVEELLSMLHCDREQLIQVAKKMKRAVVTQIQEEELTSCFSQRESFAQANANP